jgi:hypothetical protein
LSCVNLPDDELWRAIAENTNAMSALVDEQLEINELIGAADPADRATLLRTYLDTINQFRRDYRDCAAELRRRYNIKANGHRIAESAKKILSNASA